MTSPGGSSTSSRDGSPSRDASLLAHNLNPPIVLKRGARGFGFNFRSVRVYIGESDVYTLQHIVTVSSVYACIPVQAYLFMILNKLIYCLSFL